MLAEAIEAEGRRGLHWREAVQAATGLLKIFSFAEFFDAAAATLARLLDADGAALIVYEGPDRLRYRLFHGLERVNQETVAKFSFPVGKGTVGRVLRSGHYLFTRDYPHCEDAMAEFVEAGLRANLVLPLAGPSGFVGALAISWLHRQPEVLEPASLVIAEMFAALIGSAVYRENLEKQLEDHSLTDPLTGLPNRRMLMTRLEEAQKRACRNQTLLALAVVDLDGFKAVNDELGHAVGDQKLLRATEAIRGAVRESDTVARFGGDEFVVVLEGLRSPREVRAILARIVRAVGEQADDAITASLGAAVYPIDFTEPEVLLKRADAAMYRAKREGGNRFAIHAPEVFAGAAAAAVS